MSSYILQKVGYGLSLGTFKKINNSFVEFFRRIEIPEQEKMEQLFPDLSVEFGGYSEFAEEMFTFIFIKESVKHCWDGSPLKMETLETKQGWEASLSAFCDYFRFELSPEQKGWFATATYG